MTGSEADKGQPWLGWRICRIVHEPWGPCTHAQIRGTFPAAMDGYAMVHGICSDKSPISMCWSPFLFFIFVLLIQELGSSILNPVVGFPSADWLSLTTFFLQKKKNILLYGVGCVSAIKILKIRRRKKTNKQQAHIQYRNTMGFSSWKQFSETL